MLLSKHSALLRAAEEFGRKERVVTARNAVTGSLAWLVMGACAVYALVSVVEEELAFQFGTARVTLVITQVSFMSRIKNAAAAAESSKEKIPPQQYRIALFLSGSCRRSHIGGRRARPMFV